MGTNNMVNMPDGFEVFFKPVVSEKKQAEPKYGYKGFDKDLKCRDHQFTIGEVATKPEKDVISLCSADGFRYCNNLTDVFSHYPKNSTNRFCKIEILGNFKDDDGKSITTSLKVVEEITPEALDDLTYMDNINLDTIRKIQRFNPLVHVGGSAGLFLHGVRLKRLRKKGSSDIDIVAPFYIQLQGEKDDEIEHYDGKSSGNDFDETIIYCGTKVDMRVDPKQRYEVIEYDGFSYKVSLLEVIMAAKFKYALNGQKKHKEDVYEICKNKKSA